MNSKQFKLLIGAFFVICGLGVILLTRDRGSWQQDGREMGAKVFADFPLNDVAAITITGESNSLSLAKVGEGTGSKWTVVDRSGYPANYDTISDLLRKTWELKVLRPVKVGASQLASLELGEPGKGGGAGMLVAFKGKDGKELHRLLLGKQHMRDSGATELAIRRWCFP